MRFSFWSVNLYANYDIHMSMPHDIITNYSQQDTYFLEFIYYSISSTVAASSSIGWQYLKLYVQLRAPDDGRRNHLKHVERM
jgi:hypothetical protein